MLFWKKTASQQIIDDLRTIERQTVNLENFEEVRKATKTIVNVTISRIVHAKREIKEKLVDYLI